MAAWCSLQNGACAPGPGRDPASCICNTKYAVAPAVCGCGDWFP
jgi:hypothetical protein